MKVVVSKQQDSSGRHIFDFTADQKAEMAAFMSRVKNGAMLRLTVERERGAASQKTRSLYFACLGALADALGTDQDTLHEFFRHKFLSDTSCAGRLMRSAGIYKVRSTSRLTQGEMNDYLNKIHQFCMDELDFIFIKDKDLHDEQRKAQ